MKNKYPRIAIIIINWNCFDDTKECVESLRKMDYPNYEVIIVDNASTDSSPNQIAEQIPNVTFLRLKENLGYGGGNNYGMKYALEHGAEYFWLLNADTVVEPDALTKLVETLEQDSETGCVSSVLYFYSNRTKIQNCGAVVDWQNYTKHNINNLNEIKGVDPKNFWLWSTSVLIRREVIEKIGYFNTKVFVYGDDMEYLIRAGRSGYINRIAPDSKIYHKCHDVESGGKRNLPLHFFFYVTRNELWIWMSNTKGLRKLFCLRKYLIQIMREVSLCKTEGYDDIIDAYMDGLYWGFRNMGGKWDKTIKMPTILKKCIVSYPYLWTDILRGNFKKIISEFLQKFKGNPS